MVLGLTETIFLAKCTICNHSLDAKIVKELRKMDGVSDAYETHVNYKNNIFCMAVKTKSEQNMVDQINKKLKQNKDLTGVERMNDI